jgi:hypothetical protein
VKDGDAETAAKSTAETHALWEFAFARFHKPDWLTRDHDFSKLNRDVQENAVPLPRHEWTAMQDCPGILRPLKDLR